MLLFAPYLMFFFFSGNVTNFPAVLQPSSTCQWFRLLTACCQRFTNQPIVFCIVRPTLNSLALAKRAVSLFSSRAAALISRVSRLRRSRARALLSLNLKKKRDCSQSKLSKVHFLRATIHPLPLLYRHKFQVSLESLRVIKLTKLILLSLCLHTVEEGAVEFLVVLCLLP